MRGWVAGVAGVIGVVGIIGVFRVFGIFGEFRESRELPAFVLTKTHDSLYHLNQWRLDYPVYRFDMGDVDGDGKVDALVGVVKKTRFHREKGRRIFIFKEINGKVRPLWLGSKLAGELQDFRYIENGVVRSLEAWPDGLYSVAEWRWKGFGLSYERYLVHRTDKTTATQYFNYE